MSKNNTVRSYAFPDHLVPRVKYRSKLFPHLDDKATKASAKLTPFVVKEHFGVDEDTAIAWTAVFAMNKFRVDDVFMLDVDQVRDHPAFATMSIEEFESEHGLDRDQARAALRLYFATFNVFAKASRILPASSVLPASLVNPASDQLHGVLCKAIGVAAKQISQISEKNALRQRIVAAGPRGRGGVEKVTMHLGPTNSGKTYHALEQMVATWKDDPNARIAYAGPLRLLSAEVRDDLARMTGDESAVGMITGDRQENPEAPIVACTVECAPREGDLLVVDECHWAMDDDRGKNWTDLIMSSQYREIVLLGPSECEGPLSTMVSDAEEVEVIHHERLCPLEWEANGGGALRRYRMNEVAPGTAVVAFSKKAVLALAEEISLHTDLKVTALYGALPSPVRQERIEGVRRGDYDVVACTDVLGHGINIPVETVLFAETNKYDGTCRRNLKLWETAQIAGRAGRYGHHESGKVAALVTEWGDVKDKVITRGADAAAGKIPTELEKMRCRISPTLKSLSLLPDQHHLLHEAIDIWRETCANVGVGVDIQPSTMTSTLENYHAVAVALGKTLGADRLSPKAKPDSLVWSMSLEDLWALVRGPFDAENGVVAAAGRLLESGDARALQAIVDKCLSTSSRRPSMTDIENTYRVILELLSLKMVLADNVVVQGVVDTEAMDAAQDALVALYLDAEGKVHAGYCSRCGDPTNAPWFDTCYSCFRGSRYDSYDDYSYGGGYRHYTPYEEIEVDEGEKEEYKRARREFLRARSASSRQVRECFTPGQKVKVDHKCTGYLRDGEVIKVNPTKTRVKMFMSRGEERIVDVHTCYLAENNSADVTLPEGWKPFSTTPKPVDPAYRRW